MSEPPPPTEPPLPIYTFLCKIFTDNYVRVYMHAVHVLYNILLVRMYLFVFNVYSLMAMALPMELEPLESGSGEVRMIICTMVVTF